MGWRYGACQRIYKSFDGTLETFVELVEVYPDLGDKSYTAEPVTISVDITGEEGKKDLARWLRQAARDVEENDLIIDDDIRYPNRG